jgi:hypothetical protein
LRIGNYRHGIQVPYRPPGMIHSHIRPKCERLMPSC